MNIQELEQCTTCGGTGEIILSEFPTAEGEHTLAVCIECNGSGNAGIKQNVIDDSQLKAQIKRMTEPRVIRVKVTHMHFFEAAL